MAVGRPDPEDLQRVFDEQNPWQRTGKVPATLARTVERPLATQLWQRLQDDEPHRFQLVLGPRRVGKTTALYQTVRHLLEVKVEPDRIWWMRLDHPLLLQESLGDLVRAVPTTSLSAQRPVFLMLDELDYTEGLDPFFDEQWPVRIAATSSATAALRERRLESTTGRWSEQHLTPYLFTEFLALVGQDRPVVVGDTLADSLAMLQQGQRADPDLAAWRRLFMLVGGFPELLTAARDKPDEDEPSRLLESQQVLRTDAVERAIYKDIPQSFGVDNPMMLERLLYVLAAQVTGLLSPSNICGDLGLSQPTFDRYLSYLEQAFLVFTLPNYSGREATVQKRGRKLYFVDGAIRNAALQRGLAPLDNPTELGALLENLVAATVQSLALHSGVRLYHWHDGKHEVDLVFDHPDHPLAFEIGASPDHSRAGLRALMERHPRFKGRCFLIAPQATVGQPDSMAAGVGTLPLDLFLQLVGAQAEAALAANLEATRPTLRAR
ncbi:MAG TPA: ATP-binding protein [Acidimicrobiales bacterium]|nr:ATP-binding protein [Acidimicrobiales bacterium]